MNWDLFQYTDRGERILNYGILEKNIVVFKVVRKHWREGQHQPGVYLSCFRTNARFGADIGHKSAERYAAEDTGEERTYYKGCEAFSPFKTTLGIACWENKEPALYALKCLLDKNESRCIIRTEAIEGTCYVRSTVNSQKTIWLEKLIIGEEVS